MIILLETTFIFHFQHLPEAAICFALRLVVVIFLSKFVVFDVSARENPVNMLPSFYTDHWSFLLLRGSPYTISAMDTCKSALNAVQILRRTKGSSYVQRLSVWHMIAAFSVQWKYTTSPLTAGIVGFCSG
jgi:hypothetical protein